MRSAMAATPGVWWLECRRERVAFYRRLGFDLVEEAAVPPDIRATIGGASVAAAGVHAARRRLVEVAEPGHRMVAHHHEAHRLARP